MNRRLVPMPKRNHAAGPPKGSIAYDRLMQASIDPSVSMPASTSAFKWDARWIWIAVLAIGGLKFWPLLVVATLAALYRVRGGHPPDVYIPYAYQFKWDGGWIFVTVLGGVGALGLTLAALSGTPPGALEVIFALIACFIALMRCVVWLCFRFPLTSWFFVSFFSALLGGRRRRW